MDKEELRERYEAFGEESVYAEAVRAAASCYERAIAATGHPANALASLQRAYTPAPEDYGISMRYSTADLLERQGRPAEAALEWRFIIDWCEERGHSIAADRPKRELQRLEGA